MFVYMAHPIGTSRKSSLTPASASKGVRERRSKAADGGERLRLAAVLDEMVAA